MQTRRHQDVTQCRNCGMERTSFERGRMLGPHCWHCEMLSGAGMAFMTSKLVPMTFTWGEGQKRIQETCRTAKRRRKQKAAS